MADLCETAFFFSFFFSPKLNLQPFQTASRTHRRKCKPMSALWFSSCGAFRQFDVLLIPAGMDLEQGRGGLLPSGNKSIGFLSLPVSFLLIVVWVVSTVV